MSALFRVVVRQRGVLEHLSAFTVLDTLRSSKLSIIGETFQVVGGWNPYTPLLPPRLMLDWIHPRPIHTRLSTPRALHLHPLDLPLPLAVLALW
jgi:hypothetical protein